MIQITLQFENASVKNRLLKVIELMNGVSVVKPQNTKTKKKGLEEALEDVEAGRVSKYASVDDFFKEIGV
jgi:hypothetical protein